MGFKTVPRKVRFIIYCFKYWINYERYFAELLADLGGPEGDDFGNNNKTAERVNESIIT